MSTILGVNKLQVEAFGEETVVPEDDYAKLMYYLHCIYTVIEPNDYSISRLRDYKHYYNLSSSEKDTVYDHAILFEPQLFINANIIIVDQSLLIDHLDNKFYKITDERIAAHVDDEFMIGGKTVRVLNVMACNDIWLNNNYYSPIERLTRLKRQSKNIIIPGKEITPIVTTDFPIKPRTIVINQTTNFGTSPISLYCQFCKNPITTKTKCRFNFLSCCCFMFSGWLYIVFQICRGKDPICRDVIHHCPICGATLGEYKAC